MDSGGTATVCHRSRPVTVGVRSVLLTPCEGRKGWEQLARVIGARVRAARAASRRTQVVVAGLAGITTDYLHQIEHGKKLPTIAVLTQLAQVLNLPLSRLLDQPPSRSGD